MQRERERERETEYKRKETHTKREREIENKRVENIKTEKTKTQGKERMKGRTETKAKRQECKHSGLFGQIRKSVQTAYNIGATIGLGRHREQERHRQACSREIVQIVYVSPC